MRFFLIEIDREVTHTNTNTRRPNRRPVGDESSLFDSDSDAESSILIELMRIDVSRAPQPQPGVLVQCVGVYGWAALSI